MLTPHDTDIGSPPPLGVHLINATELASRIISSPFVEWDTGSPRVAPERLTLALELDHLAGLLDPVGIQWLPAVAFNELPSSLAASDIQPQDLLEQKTFRLLTATFLFDGERYGEARRGQPLPDALLHLPGGSMKSAILDCKAAASGYRMESDHVLRFIRYWETLSPRLTEEGRSIEYLTIVSSYFPGEEGDRHPFHTRYREIVEKTGLILSYISASDLAWAAAQLEAREMALQERRVLDWPTLLKAGIVRNEDLVKMIGGTR